MKVLGISLKKVQKKGTKPRTKLIWVITEPSLSPTEISPCPRYVEIRLLMISGKSEPREAITKPIVKVLKPIILASLMS